MKLTYIIAASIFCSLNAQAQDSGDGTIPPAQNDAGRIEYERHIQREIEEIEIERAAKTKQTALQRDVSEEEYLRHIQREIDALESPAATKQAAMQNDASRDEYERYIQREIDAIEGTAVNQPARYK